ncbi:RHS repeat-associated core domain-containing protein [Fodinicola acaciae]|uniref:RHS repeat-associated core domain-containing protein n=1 Tax=Fodinicola acaciae TaxID=2681555 RepID=UPI0013CF84B4|nr:RHS repeat-associated core domain-containing protein [Fodinicola acaciae]
MLLLTITLVVTSHDPAVAAPWKPADPVFQPKKEKSVPVSKVTPKALPADPGAKLRMTKAPAVSWPAAATADAQVAAAPTARSGKMAAQVPATGRAGTLPVWVTAPTGKQAKAQANTPAPTKVRVENLGRKGNALWLRLARTDGVEQPGTVGLQVSYQSFRNAYGGDWANRLQLVKLPACAFANQAAAEAGQPPAVAAGCVPTVVPSHNDGSGVITADVPVAADGAAPAAYAVQAAIGGSAGTFAATSLAPSATWQVGGAAGDFNWSYPMEMPPAIGGPAAKVSLDYSSGGVDGRTSATNNQPSWAGEGFELTPGGSVERRYASCAQDTKGNNGTKPVGDLCWKTDNATFTLNGKGGELVKDDTTGQWHMKGDDGTVVTRQTGAPNGDNDGEYWIFTTKDGTKYYFGLNHLPGYDSTPDDPKKNTNSAWTVPVAGNDVNEPCHKTAFADSFCDQAYRWNLDYVVDRHGNTMSLFYATEINHYARNATATTVSAYVRGGNIDHIDYGQQDGRVYTDPAIARVLFTTAERCVPGSACTYSQPQTYPDTPLDQLCDSTTNCDKRFNPGFFTTKMLTKVTSQVWRGSAYGDVDSWSLAHSFRDPGDGTRAGLWLDGIGNAGLVGGSVQTPQVTFDSIQLANRVVIPGDNEPPMNWLRVSTIKYGTGGTLAVTYSPPECAAGNLPAAADTNTMRCHPIKWTAPNETAQRTDWFHKYVVTQVTEADLAGGNEPVVTQVKYLSAPAWRHDDEDGLVPIGEKTWGQWRGYDHVQVLKGNPGGPQTVTDSRYFRGMDGDLKADGSHKSVPITDSTGGTVADHVALAGQLREQDTLNGTQLVSRTITDPWVSAATAVSKKDWGTTSAYETQQAGNHQAESLDGGALRQSAANNIYAADGTLLASNDQKDLSNPNDDTCTRYEYANNASAGLSELPTRKQTVAVGCDKSYTPQQVLSDERTYYDGATSPTTPPTKGDVTRTDRLSGFDSDGTPRYQTVKTAKYDAIGRATQITDALNNVTTTDFTPSGAGPLTKTTITQANGQTAVTELEPAWGKETAVTDAGGHRTEATYDPLGRAVSVWLPGRSGGATPAGDPAAKAGANIAGKAAAADNASVPNMHYTYSVQADAASSVTTDTLQTDGSLRTTYTMSDGLLRKVQTQEPAPGGGRTLTDVRYDSRGLEVKSDGPYYNDAPPNTDVLTPDESALPTQKITEYDLAARPTAEVFRSDGEEKWRTTHTYAGDHQTDDPPAGDAPSTRFTNVQGQVTELREYAGSSPTGSYDKTAYTYTPAGQLASVTDPSGNKWTFDYDVRGRKIKETDPDRGATTYTYNDLDQMTSSTDARGTTLAYTYDAIGRKTGEFLGSTSGTKLADWVYDTLTVGSPTSSTRYVNGQAYTTRITGYNSAGKPLGAQVTIPSSEGGLAGTYTTTNTYNVDGEIATSALPAIGDLPAETMQYGYDANDQPTTLSSNLTTYVRGTQYTPFGEVSLVTLGSTGGKWVQLGYEYEQGTRRLQKVTTDKETLPRRISSVAYTYDPGGNITSVTDTPSSTSGQPADTQCFNYDNLRRLTSAWTPSSNDCSTAPSQSALGGPAPYWNAYTYDASGNRKTETRTTPTASTTSTYSYPAPGQPQPHGVTQVQTTGSTTGTSTYSYDATGNQLTRNGESYTWDAEGNLTKVTNGGKSTDFVYDADGNRLLRRDSTGTTLYLGDTEALLKPDGSVAGTRYYKHGKQTVAIRTAGKLTWLGADQNGTSNTAIADTATQEVVRRFFDPFGNNRGTAAPVWPGQRSFVGGTSDPSTGLIHLGAREYDPTIGRFISVDPKVDYQQPDTLNAYSYANNNPVTFTDPDGTSWFSDIITSVKSVAQTVVNRVVDTVKQAVQVVTPVINWVKDQATAAFEAVKSFVQKTVEVVKQVVKTVVKVVKKVVKEVKKVVKQVAKVAKKVASAVKDTVKKVASKVGAAAVAVGKAVAKAATAAAKWAWENREQILWTALDVGLTIAACAGTAGAGCIARGLLEVAAWTAASNLLPDPPAPAAESAAEPKQYSGTVTFGSDGKIQRPPEYDPANWKTGTVADQSMEQLRHGKEEDFKYRGHTPSTFDGPAPRRAKLVGWALSAMDVIFKIGH